MKYWKNNKKKNEDKFSIYYMYKWAWSYVKKHKYKVIILMFLTLLGVFLNLIQVDFIKQMIDSALSKNWSKIMSILLFFIGLTAGRLIRNYFSGYLSNYIEVNVSKDLKCRFTDSILKSEFNSYKKKTSGDLVSKHNNDINSVLRFIPGCYTDLMFTPLMALVAIIYLLGISWKLSLVAFISTPILALVLRVLSERSSRLNKEKLEKQSKVTEHVKNTIDGHDIIKTYSMHKSMSKRGKILIDGLFKQEARYSANDGITVGLILAVSYLPEILLLMYGGFLVINNEILLSDLFAFSLLTGMVNQPIVNLFSSLRNMKIAMRAMERVDEILSLKEERVNGENFLPDIKSSIDFSNINFSYDKPNEVITGLDFNVQKNDCVGIVGSSGVGKTTILNLLCGFITPDKGKIQVFGNDINEWNLNSLRKSYAFVSQDTYLFPESILENIRYGRLTATDEDVIEAAVKAGVDKIVMDLPDKYNTVLHQNGTGVSGGERQRIALARALLRDAPILIMDEPTASLDTLTENQIINSMKQMIMDKSVFIVTHRLSLLKLCNKIFLLDEGRIEEAGSHDELIMKKGKFYSLFKDQMTGGI